MKQLLLILALIFLLSSCSSKAINEYYSYGGQFKGYNDKIEMQISEFENMSLSNASREDLYNKSTQIEREIDAFNGDLGGFREFLIENKNELSSRNIDVTGKVIAIDSLMLELRNEKYKWSVSKLRLHDES